MASNKGEEEEKQEDTCNLGTGGRSVTIQP
jgi:hypothetical protein